MHEVTRPPAEAGEANDYFRIYIDQAPSGQGLRGLEEQAGALRSEFAAIDVARASFRYREGAWSISEVVGHLVDVERLFQSWILRIARGDEGPFLTFDQDDWVRAAEHDQRPWADLQRDFEETRAATLSLFRSLPDAAAGRSGRMGASHHFTVRAIPFILQGHVAHHQLVLRERYLG